MPIKKIYEYYISQYIDIIVRPCNNKWNTLHKEKLILAKNIES